MLTSYIIRARPCKLISLKYTDIRRGSLDWISGFQSGFLDFKVDFWISKWISGFQCGFLDFWISEWISGFRWISGFQIGFLPTVYEISFVADPSLSTDFTKLSKWLVAQCSCVGSIICYQKYVANECSL